MGIIEGAANKATKSRVYHKVEQARSEVCAVHKGHRMLGALC